MQEAQVIKRLKTLVKTEIEKAKRESLGVHI